MLDLKRESFGFLRFSRNMIKSSELVSVDVRKACVTLFAKGCRTNAE